MQLESLFNHIALYRTYCVDHRGEKIEHFEIRDASSTSNCGKYLPLRCFSGSIDHGILF